MESRANYAVVGLFTLAVLAAAFGFVYWFSGLGASDKRMQVRIVFTGTVTGLSRGSNVLFNGLRVGEVVNIGFRQDDPQKIDVVAEIDRTTPIRRDTRARLEAQGLTGVVAIQMIGGEPNAPPLEPINGLPLPTIQAERSEFQDLLETVRTLARRADNIMDNVERIVVSNGPVISNTLQNVQSFSKALGDNAPAVDRLLTSVAAAADKIGPLAERLDTLSRQVSEVVAAVDTGKITRMIDDTERFTAALGTSSGNVEKTMTNVASISDKLNKAADQVEGVLKAAQSFLGSMDGQGAVDEIQKAATSIRVLADNLDKRTAEITANINRFTGPGLRDIEALTAEGRRTLTDFNRTLRNIERNPQQFIFGGRAPIPEYSGRR